MNPKTLDEYLREKRREEKGEELGELLRSIAASIKRIEEGIQELGERVAALEAAVDGLAAEIRGTARRREREARRKTAYDFLVEQGFVSMSSLQGRVRNPRAIIDKLAERGAVIIEVENDVIAVEPGYYRRFLERLASISSYDEEKVAEQLGEQYKLFRALRDAGLVYFDQKERVWKLA